MKDNVKWKRWLAFSFAFLMFILSPVSAEAANTFNRASLDGIAFIYWEGFVERQDQEGFFYPDYVGVSGSGFFVGEDGKNPQYIVTNFHVVRDFVSVDNVIKKYSDFFQEYMNVSKNAKISFPLYVYYDQDNFEEAYIVDYDEEKDLAVLKIGSPTGQRSPLRLRKSSENLMGETVWAIGYPGVADLLADSVTSRGKNDATVTVGSINRVFVESGTGITVYQTDAKVRSGNSGGPMVDSAGNVLGINTRVASERIDPNLNYAVSIDELLPLLIKNNIPYVLAGESFFQSRFFWVIVAAAAVVLLVVLLVILLLKAKKKKPASPAKEQNAIGISPCLHALSAQHKGMVVPVTENPILIGRDVAACTVVFQEGTPGVSYRHCQLSYNKKDNTFILTDLKSTYGTFLSNGKKLDSNLPCSLKPKDTFYLGDPDNIFSVDLE